MLVLVIAPLALVVAVGSHPQPAQYGFRNRRDECVRHVAMAHLPAVPDHHLGGVRPGPGVSAYSPQRGCASARLERPVKADFVINVVQPVASSPWTRLTFHIRERPLPTASCSNLYRRPRDPNERATSLAEYGEIVETGRGTFLAGQWQACTAWRAVEPTRPCQIRTLCIDLSRFTGGPQLGHSGFANAILDVAFPDPNIHHKQVPTHFRSELHDGSPRRSIRSRSRCCARNSRRPAHQPAEAARFRSFMTVGNRCAASDTGLPATCRSANRGGGVCAVGSLLLTFVIGLFVIARGAVIERPRPHSNRRTCSSACRGLTTVDVSGPEWSHARSSFSPALSQRVMSVFLASSCLIVLIDYIELMRRAADVRTFALDGCEDFVLSRAAAHRAVAAVLVLWRDGLLSRAARRNELWWRAQPACRPGNSWRRLDRLIRARIAATAIYNRCPP